MTDCNKFLDDIKKKKKNIVDLKYSGLVSNDYILLYSKNRLKIQIKNRNLT